MTFDDVGDPDGTPVVSARRRRLSAVAPSGRLDRRLAGCAAAGARPLRPGARGRTLRRWAEEAAAALGRALRVVGWSAGGPHALALAAVAPERVTRVALVGSMPPPDGVAALPRDVRRLMRVARRAPHRRAGARAVGQAAAAADGRPGHRRGVRPRPRRVVPPRRPLARARARLPRPPLGLRARGGACARDALVGSATTSARRRSARYARDLPNAELRLVDGTHQLLFSRWREILADAAGGPRGAPRGSRIAALDFVPESKTLGEHL